MRSSRFGLVLAAGAVGMATGCVDRRFLVETNVPGAQVYVDGKQLGTSPADGQWEYAGYRKFTAVAPGYAAAEPSSQSVATLDSPASPQSRSALPTSADVPKASPSVFGMRHRWCQSRRAEN